MASESIYVAAGIACVVALLMVAVMVVYCIKRHQDKLQHRLAMEERARRERSRRHPRGDIVRPPPYEANPRQVTAYPAPMPFTPPPAYKEFGTPLSGTPLPPANVQPAGIGGVAYGPPPVYDPLPTDTQNVPSSAPAPTYITHVVPSHGHDTSASQQRRDQQPNNVIDVNSQQDNNNNNNRNDNNTNTSNNNSNNNNNNNNNINNSLHNITQTGTTRSNVHTQRSQNSSYQSTVTVSNNRTNDNTRATFAENEQNIISVISQNRHGIPIPGVAPSNRATAATTTHLNGQTTTQSHQPGHNGGQNQSNNARSSRTHVTTHMIQDLSLI